MFLTYAWNVEKEEEDHGNAVVKHRRYCAHPGLWTRVDCLRAQLQEQGHRREIKCLTSQHCDVHLGWGDIIIELTNQH